MKDSRFRSVRLLAVLAALTAHALTAVAQTPQQLNELSTLLTQYKTAMVQEKYAEAEPLARRMVAIADQSLQNRPDMVAEFVDLWGDCFSKQERYADALPLRERAVAVAQRGLGPEHEKVPSLLHDLGDCYWNLQQYDKAAPCYAKALAIREKRSGAASADAVDSRKELALSYFHLQRYAEAETLYRKNLQIAESQKTRDDADVARLLHSVADSIWNQQKYADSLPLYERAAQVREKALGPGHADTTFSRKELALSYEKLHRFADAEQVRKAVLDTAEKTHGAASTEMGEALSELATLYESEKKFGEVESLHRRALAIQEQALGADSADLAYYLDNVANASYSQARYAEAEPLYQRSLALREKGLGADHPDMAYSLHNLAALYLVTGRYAEAEPMHKRALALREKAFPEDNLDVAYSLTEMASLYYTQGRYAEAEPLYRRALAIREKLQGAKHPDVAAAINNLALGFYAQSRFAEAEPLFKRALAIRDEVLGPNDPDVAGSLNDLANLLLDEGRMADAEALYRRALTIREKSNVVDHPELGTALNNLASVCKEQGKYDEAIPLYQRAIAVWERGLGKNHPDLAFCTTGLASVQLDSGKVTDAEQLYKQALAVREKAFGPEHPLVAGSLSNLAYFYVKQGRHAEAEEMLDRAIAIFERLRVMPDVQFTCHQTRAEVSWKAGRKGEAVADLRRAMDLAEQIRGQSGGAEQERAVHFGRYMGAFEEMVAWQTEIGDVGETLSAIERGRARSLLDEMNVGGADLNLGRTVLEREELRRQEAAIKTRVDGLQREFDAIKGAGATTEAERTRIQAQLSEARGQLYDHYRSERSTSPVYRNLLAVGGGTPRLSQLQRRLTAGNGLLLVYMFGDEAGYVLAIGPQSARALKLEVPETLAKTLGIEPGALTATKLQDVLVREKQDGLVQQLAASQKKPVAAAKLNALWQLLVPQAEREEIAAGKVKRLLIVPDGPLALLPFEALVLEPATNPKYLLDVEMPILYAPSATVLYNLWDRPASQNNRDGKPVLTVGDPTYGAPDTTLVADARGAKDGLADIAPRTRYGGAGGRLMALPNTGIESGWVADVFGKQGVGSGKLTKAEATEAKVRASVPGRRIIHLACHGLTDQAYGNFFGALALTPGAQAAEDPADDGFLTLAEIYELNLKGCELSILSACETNYGPRQQGEGVWALSRGFLVAGSRRVVASNWLVDDEAAASLVSYFCAIVADSEKKGTPADYAAALHAAKRWVRTQDKWKSPYYWGTFVLVGPN